MPYLTPPSTPEGRDCRALLIPSSSDWLAIFGGALTELSLRWNWEQQGISVDDALAVVSEVLEGFYTGCVNSGCQQPGDLPVVRVNPDTWRIEQLVNGEWVEPQGEYALPPTPARTESTPEERQCLAAANAVNALHTLYEDLSDSWGEALSLEATINSFMAVLIGIVGTAFALPVAALIGIFVALMAVVYETIEYITADLWDTNFTDLLECIFYECSSEIDDVVHFDIQCIINKIGSDVTWDLYTETQIRLLLQVSYLLNVLGSQTIDAAGATTAIASADCDDCGDPCRHWLGGFGLNDMLPVQGSAYVEIGDYVDSADFGTASYASAVVPVTEGSEYNISFTAEWFSQSGAGDCQIYWSDDAIQSNLIHIWTWTGFGDGVSGGILNATAVPAGYPYLYITVQAVGSSATVNLTGLALCG